MEITWIDFQIGITMPNAHIKLDETEQSIFRPSVLAVVDQIRTNTSIDKSVRVLFPGDIQVAIQKGADMGNSPILPTFSSEESITISATENYDITHIGSTRMDQLGSTPIFIDNSIGIAVLPVYVDSEVEIRFTYKCQSKSKAQKWVDEIRLRLSQLVVYDVHDVQYHYVMPAKLIKMLSHVHDKKEAVAGYGETFEEYLSRSFTKRMTSITDSAAKDKRYAVRETQAEVQGEFGFDANPTKPEKNNDNGTWTINFEYKYMYNKVIALRTQYPIMVHNQLLDPIYSVLPANKRKKPLDNVIYNGWSHMYKIFGIENVNASLFDPSKSLHIPAFDEWRVVGLPYFKKHFLCLSVLCQMNQNDKRELVNLTQLGDVAIQNDIVQWLKDGEYVHVTREDGCFISVRLFTNNEPMPRDAITVDSDLTVRTVQEMNPRVAYRVCVFLHTDMERLRPEAFERLASHPNALTAIITALDTAVRQITMGDAKYPGTHVARADMAIIYWILSGKRLFHDEPWLSNIPRNVITDLASRFDVTDFVKNNLIRSAGEFIHLTSREVASRFKENVPMFLLKVRNKVHIRSGINTMNSFIYPVKRGPE